MQVIAPVLPAPPAGWAGQAAGYHNVYGKSCRTCHVARDEGARYTEAGVARFGVNPGSLESHVEFRDKYTLDFPLIVEENAEIASAFRPLESSV